RFYFFFQAEDGIRDKLVTGVQTCALPIFGEGQEYRPVVLVVREFGVNLRQASDAQISTRPLEPRDVNGKLLIKHKVHRRPCSHRSEERRVGKECRAGLSP